MKFHLISTLLRLFVGKPGAQSAPEQPIVTVTSMISDSSERALSKMSLIRLIAFADTTKQRMKLGKANPNLWIRSEYWLDKKLSELPVETFLQIYGVEGISSHKSPPNTNCL